MKKALSANQVVIVLVGHPILGILLTPYTVSRTPDDALEVTEQAFHSPPDAIKKTDETRQKVINIASHYTEKYLIRVYSREKTVPKFLHKLAEDNNKLKEQIHPFIEEKPLEILELIRTRQLPFYQKPSGSRQLYEHHAYRVHPRDLGVHFSFKVTEEYSSYQLQCYYDDLLVSLMKQKPATILTSNPAALLLDMDLFTVPHIKASRLLPFTKKERINVDASLTEKYINNTMIPLAYYYEVNIQGVKMIREEHPCDAYFYLEDTIYNDTLLRLDFRYRDRIFSPHGSSRIEKIIFREQENGQTVIHYFQRNSTAEKRAVRLLQKAGLRCVSDFHFKLSPTAPKKNIIKWVSRHREILLEGFILSSDTHKKPYYLPDTRIEQDYEGGPDWFKLHVNVVMDSQKIPFSRFRKDILDNNREYLLSDGRVILLPEEWPTKYANLLEVGKESGKNIRLKRPFVSVIRSVLEKDPDIATGVRLEKPIPVPAGLKANLCSYQQKGFSWMANLYLEEFGGCLANDMSLGRTLQILTLLQYIYKPRTAALTSQETNSLEEKENTQGFPVQKEAFFDEKRQLSLLPVKTEAPNTSRSGQNDLQRAVLNQKKSQTPRLYATPIVVPTSLLHNWEREASRFTNPSMMEYNGSSANEINHLPKCFDQYHLVFTTYGTMRNNIATLSQYKFEYIVLDESRSIKNSESLTFRSAI